jgi:hypothetical protein
MFFVFRSKDIAVADHAGYSQSISIPSKSNLETLQPHYWRNFLPTYRLIPHRKIFAPRPAADRDENFQAGFFLV